ncbi:MAG TPA: helix-turn-helix transcriptional regulator [Chloroflexia bacterium]|jgi:transcriptional regulator with XRE-family HTH domain
MSLHEDNPAYKLLLSRIAELISGKRKDKHLSKSAFALELNLPRARYANIEACITRLYVYEIFMMADVLGIEPADLWLQLTDSQAVRDHMFKVDVPADVGKKVQIVVNVVEGQDRPKKG